MNAFIRTTFILSCFLAFARTSTMASSSIPQTHQSEEKDLAISVNDTANIVGGRPATKPFPWYAIPADHFTAALCGAVLIHPDILLSAAHCAKSFLPSSFVQLGGTSRNGLDDETEQIPIQKVIVHPHYKRADGIERTLSNDIMLIQLQQPIVAAVVPWNTIPTIPRNGERLEVMGYGRTIGNKGMSWSDTLLQTKVQAIPKSACQTLLEVEVTSLQLCTFRPNTAPCYGDSGGPLITSGGVLVGLVSQGQGSCTLPTVYTKVSAYQTFIETGICELSNDRPASCPPQKPPPHIPACEAHCRNPWTQQKGKWMTREGIVGRLAGRSGKGGKCIQRCVATGSLSSRSRAGWACGQCPS